MSRRVDLDGLRFDPGPDCSTGCELTVDRYCDLSCMFVEPEPLTWAGDDG